MKSIFRRPRVPSRRRANEDLVDSHITPFDLKDDERGAFSQAKVDQDEEEEEEARRRLLSFESEFRIRRVELSPLCLATKGNVNFEREEEAEELFAFEGETDSPMEHLRDISSAARAYLPASSSLLTNSTAYDTLSNVHSFALGQVDEMRTWPSSVLLHVASSPVRRREAASKQEASEDIGHIVDSDAMSKQPLTRMQTCPALRGLSHAQRQRESMMLAHAKSLQMDEFGTLINILRQKEDESIPITPSLPRRRHARPIETPKDTFPFTPQRLASETSSGFANRDSQRSSVRSRRFILNDILPSPSSSVFQFPALCVAAVEQASLLDMLASSLASARVETTTVESLDQRPLVLGSPIQLKSELAQHSHRSSSSLTAAAPPSSSSFEGDRSFIQMPSMVVFKAQVKSQSMTFDRTLPTMMLGASESAPVITTTSQELVKEAQRTLTPPPPPTISSFHHRTVSNVSVQSILVHQQEAMDRLRISPKWSSDGLSLPVCTPSLEDKSGQKAILASPVAEDSLWTQSTLDTDDEADGCKMDHEGDECKADEQEGPDDPSYEGTNSSRAAKASQKVPSEEIGAGVELQGKAQRADKATQTDKRSTGSSKSGRTRRAKHTPPPGSPQPSFNKAPGICILLATPRKMDEEEAEADAATFMSTHDQHFGGLGIHFARSSADKVVTESRKYLMPSVHEHRPDVGEEGIRLADDPLLLPETIHTASESLFDLHSILLSSGQQRQTFTTMDGTEDAAMERIHASPLPPPTLSPPLSARESTTTAAIEALLEHLHRAQQGHQGHSLRQGGRRHERD